MADGLPNPNDPIDLAETQARHVIVNGKANG